MQSVLSLRGSSLRYLVQQGLELVLVATFITIFIYLQLRESATSITKSQLTEAFPLVSTIKQDIALEYMESGFWPQAQWLSEKYEFVSTQIVKSAYFDGQGGIHLSFTDESPQLAGRTLSFIAAVDKQSYEQPDLELRIQQSTRPLSAPCSKPNRHCPHPFTCKLS